MEKEFIRLAQMVADLIQQDKAGSAYIAADEETRIKLCLAYGDEAGKRITRLQNLSLTNPEFKEMFMRTILGICKTEPV